MAQYFLSSVSSVLPCMNIHLLFCIVQLILSFLEKLILLVSHRVSLRNEMEAWMEINGPLQLKEEIGLGAYGRVYRVEYQGAQCEGQKLHSALLEPGIEGYTVVKDSFLSECSLLMKIHHPHIMATYGVYQSSSHSPLILSELMTQTLRQLIRTSHPLHWTQHHPIMLQVTSGLCYLHHHSPPLIHRNLTSANVFLDRGGVAKIAYLGLSRLFTDSSKELSPCPGNVGYLPPEALQQSALYSPKLDVFSLGVLLLESLTGNLPAPGPLFSEVPPDQGFTRFNFLTRHKPCFYF